MKSVFLQSKKRFFWKIVLYPPQWNSRKPSAVIMPKLRGCLTDGSGIEEGVEPQGAV